MFLPMIDYCYLVSSNIADVSISVCIFLAVILSVFIVLLNWNHGLVNRKTSEYIISRSEDPKRVDSLLVECAEPAANGTASTQMYVFLWKTSGKTPGHLSVQLYDKKKTFMSRWPGERVKFLPILAKIPVAAVFNDSVADDIESEHGYKPDAIIIIPEGMISQENIDDIILWYETVAKGPTGIYKGKFKNCADLVRQALKVGKFYLANPSLRWLKLGLSVPNDIADRIIYTISLKRSDRWIKFLHHNLTITVWMISMHLAAVVFGLIKPKISITFSTFLFQIVWLLPYHLLRALD